MKSLCKIFLFLSFIILSTGAFAQTKKPKSVEKQRKEFLELQEERKEAAAEAREEGIKEHKELQTKDVQKRMKRSNKKSRRLAKDRHQDGFLKMLFTKKR